MFHCLVIKVVLLSFLCDSLFILPHLFSFVKNFFQVFFKTFRWSFLSSLTTCLLYHKQEALSTTFLIFLKFHFSKNQKRRRRDLNPRAALTTYTLSRGTSSASWVLLQSPNYLTNVKLWSCASFVAHLLLYLKDHFLSTSFLSFLFFIYFHLPG